MNRLFTAGIFPDVSILRGEGHHGNGSAGQKGGLNMDSVGKTSTGCVRVEVEVLPLPVG